MDDPVLIQLYVFVVFPILITIVAVMWAMDRARQAERRSARLRERIDQYASVAVPSDESTEGRR